MSEEKIAQLALTGDRDYLFLWFLGEDKLAERLYRAERDAERKDATGGGE